MEMDQAISALDGLSHPIRLGLYRALVRAGESGMVAGQLAEKLNAGASTLSFHLAHLERAGLIAGTREGRFIRYTIQPATMRHLLDYLTDDCCEGRPELCGFQKGEK